MLELHPLPHLLEDATYGCVKLTRIDQEPGGTTKLRPSNGPDNTLVGALLAAIALPAIAYGIARMNVLQSGLARLAMRVVAFPTRLLIMLVFMATRR